jgi:hypothetical protein
VHLVRCGRRLIVPRLQLKTLLELPTIQWELYLFLVPSAVTDIAIALTLSILFLRSRTGIKSYVLDVVTFLRLQVTNGRMYILGRTGSYVRSSSRRSTVARGRRQWRRSRLSSCAVAFTLHNVHQR